MPTVKSMLHFGDGPPAGLYGCHIGAIDLSLLGCICTGVEALYIFLFLSAATDLLHTPDSDQCKAEGQARWRALQRVEEAWWMRAHAREHNVWGMSHGISKKMCHIPPLCKRFRKYWKGRRIRSCKRDGMANTAQWCQHLWVCLRFHEEKMIWDGLHQQKICGECL